jgi:hypothetical protein
MRHDTRRRRDVSLLRSLPRQHDSWRVRVCWEQVDAPPARELVVTAARWERAYVSAKC